MGKGKGGGKKANIFKVAGAKSLKAKSKAKPFVGNLKKINETVRKQIDKIDKDLVNLKTDMRKQKEVKMETKANKEMKEDKKSPAELEQEREKTLERLNEMAF